MVKRLAAAALAGAVLLLSGCGLFTLSIFPQYLPGLTASKDLRLYIDDYVREQPNDWWSFMRVVRFGGADYVFLGIGLSYSPGTKLIVMDSSLEVLKVHYDLPVGQFSMVDAQGRILFGSQAFGAPEADPVDVPMYTVASYLPPWNGGGFAYGGLNYVLWSDSGAFNYVEVSSDWSTATPAPPASPLSPAVSGGTYEVRGVAWDPEHTGEEVMVGFVDWGARLAAVALLPATYFQAGSTAPITPTFTVEDADPQNIHYTRKGIVLQGNDRRMLRYDFSGKLLEETTLPPDHEMQPAYDIDGQSYYYFDRDARMLLKGKTGW